MEKAGDELVLSVTLGQGRVSVSSGIADDIPSIIIRQLVNPLPVGVEIPQGAKTAGPSIVLRFYSVEAINVWRKQLDATEKLLEDAKMDQKTNNKKKEPHFWESEPPIWACTNKKERADFADELYESEYDKEWN